MMSIVQFLEERYAMIDPSVQGIFDECPGAKACEQSEPASPSESAGLRARVYSVVLEVRRSVASGGEPSPIVCRRPAESITQRLPLRTMDLRIAVNNIRSTRVHRDPALSFRQRRRPMRVRISWTCSAARTSSPVSSVG